MSSCRRSWCCSDHCRPVPGRRLSSGRHPPLFRGQSLRPRWNVPWRGSPSRDVIRGSLTFAHHPGTAGCRPGAGKPPLPAGLLACRPRMGQGPLRLLPRASHLAVTRGARRGGDGPRALARIKAEVRIRLGTAEHVEGLTQNLLAVGDEHVAELRLSSVERGEPRPAEPSRHHHQAATKPSSRVRSKADSASRCTGRGTGVVTERCMTR
jgi:hypothetical protein